MERKEREKRNAKIIREYAVGATLTEIGKKYNLSPRGVSLILHSYKNSKIAQKTSDNRMTSEEIARYVIEDSLDSLADMPKDKIHPETLLKIIDRLTAIYGTEKTEDKPVTVNIRFRDTSKAADND